jgi:seryl-tRNA synthetase
MRTTIAGMRGQLPDLAAHGLERKLKPLAKLIDEQVRLRQRASELGAEQQQLKEQIKRRKHEHTQAWGRAMRASGAEEPPSDEDIRRAEKRLEAVRSEISAVRHAGELADAELKQTVAEHASEWDALVQERGEAILLEAQQMAEALSTKLARTEALTALHGYLASGGQFYTPPTPAAVSIDDLLHERRRELGLLDVEVVR